MLRIGDDAPQFSLPSDGNGRVNLSDYAGKKVVLYFYPKDDTPGCNKEAQDFKDNLPALKAAGAEVLGVSADTPATHDEFKAKYQLNFPLLSDPDHAVTEAYGAWREKSLYGRVFMGIQRTTVLLDEHQRVIGVWERVQVDGHAQHVLAVLRGEQPAPTPVEVEAPAKKAEPKPLPTKPTPKPMAPKAAAPAAKPAAKPAPAPKKAAPAKKPAAKPAAKKAAPKAKAKAKPAPKKAAPKAKAKAKAKPAPAKKKKKR